MKKLTNAEYVMIALICTIESFSLGFGSATGAGKSVKEFDIIPAIMGLIVALCIYIPTIIYLQKNNLKLTFNLVPRNPNSQSLTGQEQNKMQKKNDLKNDSNAVSPIIAVILMVAITVVLAATVFVLVSDIGSQNLNNPENISIQAQEDTDRLSVNSVGTSDWNNYEIVSNQAIRFKLNVEAVNTDTVSPANTWTDVTSASDPVGPGEFIDICGQSGALSNVEVKLRNTSSLIGTWNFVNVRAC